MEASLGRGGVMGIGESVKRQDQKIALCQTTVILILKGKHICCKRKGSGEESAPESMGFFHWQLLAEKLQWYF